MKRTDSTGQDWISRTISQIGKSAGVVVDRKPAAKPRKGAKEGGERVKYASAHDLRRSFGARWSQRVMPAILKELMRHASITTTMEYYVGSNSQATAKVVWEAMKAVNTSVNSPPPDAKNGSAENDGNPGEIATYQTPRS